MIRDKFYELLSRKDIEKQQRMGLDNIDYSISEEDKSKIKSYEFLREKFVQEVKDLINEDEISYFINPLNSAYDIAYNIISKIVKDPVIVIYNAITENNINLVGTLLTNLEVDPNTEFNKYRDNNFLQAACNMNNKEMVKLLLAKGTDPVIEFYNQVKENNDSKTMRFDNIDEYSKAKAAINDSPISEEDESVLNIKIKKHEFFRESFVKEFKASIEGQSKDVNDLSFHIYCDINEIARNPAWYS